MDERQQHDDLESRLGALGREPIAPDVRARHLRRAATVEPTPSRLRFGPVAIGAAAVVGFLVGSAGFAAAGALPDPAQNVAHDVFAVVQVDVPEGADRGSCISRAAKIEDKEAKQAAKDACPKSDDVGPDEEPAGEPGPPREPPGESGDAPGRSGEAPGRSGDAPGKVKHADDPCRGKPAWAGPMTKQERDALKAEHDRSACPTDDTETDD